MNQEQEEKLRKVGYTGSFTYNNTTDACIEIEPHFALFVVVVAPEGPLLFKAKNHKNEAEGKTKEEAVDLIQKTLIKYMLKNDLIVSGDVSEEQRDVIDSLYRSAIKSSAEGDMGSGQKLLDDYFSKNPLDLHVLDGMPDIKAGVLKRTGIRDLSRIGSIIGSNLL